jgi:hypothetical protein
MGICTALNIVAPLLSSPQISAIVQNGTDRPLSNGYIVCLNMTEDENHICPTCRDGTGTPRVVTAVRRMIQLDLACKECGHVWSIEYPDPTVAAFTSFVNSQM